VLPLPQPIKAGIQNLVTQEGCKAELLSSHVTARHKSKALTSMLYCNIILQYHADLPSSTFVTVAWLTEKKPLPLILKSSPEKSLRNTDMENMLTHIHMAMIHELKVVTANRCVFPHFKLNLCQNQINN